MANRLRNTNRYWTLRDSFQPLDIRFHWLLFQVPTDTRLAFGAEILSALHVHILSNHTQLVFEIIFSYAIS